MFNLAAEPFFHLKVVLKLFWYLLIEFLIVGHDGFSLSLSHVNQHVCIRVVLDVLQVEGGTGPLIIFVRAPLKIVQFKVAPATLLEGVVLGYLLNICVIELIPLFISD